MSTNESGTPEKKVRQEVGDLTLTNAIPIGISVLAPDGTILYMNSVALDLTGLTLDEVKGKSHLERACHPDDLDRILEERRMGLSNGVPFELEMRLSFKKGGYRWYLSQYKPLMNEGGNIVRWYVTATDIDDRKRAEEKLRQSEENLRTITDTIRQPIVVTEPEGTTLYANRRALDVTGLTLDVVKNEGFFPRAFHPDDVERFRAEREEGFSREAPFDLEMRFLLKNGQYLWQLIQYNPLKDERGQIVRWYATATDIDDQKRTEERLRNENIVLREEIDRSSMFGEIVGSSKPVRQLIKQVDKVAPSDATVLILGET